MGARRIVRSLGRMALGCGLLGTTGSWAAAANEVFDARGLARNRPSFSQVPFEYVDPLTGNLSLIVTDLVLPGNAGFDLKVQRAYNSKIFSSDTFGSTDSDSWVGVGWTLHFGRVATTSADQPLAVEMPDGSSHKLFPHSDGSGRFITRDYWTYDRSSVPVLKLTNGVVYTFGKFVGFGSGRYYRYVTEIRDPFNNKIEIQYAATPKTPDEISKVIQYLGPPSNPGLPKREISFATETASGGRSRLATMTYLNRTWIYSYVPAPEAGKSLLTAVRPPLGPSWLYGYTLAGPIQGELISLTTPNGGNLTWTYGTQGGGAGALAPFFHLGSSVTVRSRVVTRRTTVAPLTVGTHEYRYAQGSAANQSVIVQPASCTGETTTTTYTFSGVGNNYTTGDVWRIGLLTRRQVQQGSATLETEDIVWRSPGAADLISNAVETVGPNQDIGIYSPVVGSRALDRDGVPHTTTYYYNSVNFNDFGRPWQTVETGGAGTRTTERTFAYGFTPYIVDRVRTEKVIVGTETFQRSWVYNTANGFLTEEYGFGNTTTSGIRTKYATDATTGKGNVTAVIDGRDYQTDYTYDWGVTADVKTPAHTDYLTIDRVIKSDGTVDSETTRVWDGAVFAAAKTDYTHDDLLRELTRKPPIGNEIKTTYNNTTGRTITVTRGLNSEGETSTTTTTLDGLGRTILQSNSVGVNRSYAYDACDRLAYESYPYLGSEDEGVEHLYDGLGRLTTNRNTVDDTAVSYDYSGMTVTITDELGHRNVQQWKAFGDPNTARLEVVTAASGTADESTASYTYNALGSLLTVTQPGATRTFTYRPQDALLGSEKHPESGTTSYTYDLAGNRVTATDEAFGQSIFGYDKNNRLTSITRPSGQSAWTYYNTRFEYDHGNRPKIAENSYASSTFEYDLAGRLRTRTDNLKPTGSNPVFAFVTRYQYDGNDNLQQVTYPSDRKVWYTPDREGRIVAVGTPSDHGAYASAFEYHATGVVKAYTAGNGLRHTTTLHPRRWIDLLDAGGVLALDYGYDDAGNVTSIDENSRSGMDQGFGYDALDRMTAANAPGLWGSGIFEYSPLGNRKKAVIGGAPTTYTYGSSSNRLDSSSGADARSYGYDLNGNTKTDGLNTYEFTPDNQISRATNSSATSDYRYDAAGRRSMKVQAGLIRFFLHGPNGQVLAEHTQMGGSVYPTREIVYAGTRPIAEHAAVNFVEFAASSSQAAETGVHSVTVRVTTADGLPTRTGITIGYETRNGSALAGSDYTAKSGSLYLGPGTASGIIQISILPDSLDEDNEQFTVALTNAPGARIVGADHTVTILDDDPTPTVGLTPPAQTITNDYGQVGFKVRLSGPSGRAVSVRVATGSSGDTAVAGTHYLTLNSVYTFSPGQVEKDVNVVILANSPAASAATFTTSLSSPVNTSIVPGQASGTVTIYGRCGTAFPRPQPLWHPFFAVNTLETPDVGDFNGDGRSDIITFTRDNPAAIGDVYVAVSNGSQFVDRYGTPGGADKWSDWFAINQDEKVVIGDFDGDGLDDIATWLRTTTRQVYVARSYGTGMYPAAVWVNSIGFTTSDVLAAGDVNGDGRDDLVLFARTQGLVFVAISTGSGFGAPTQWHGFFAVSTYERPRTGDVNGDGRADIITFATDSPTAFGDVYVAVSNGSAFVDQNGFPNTSTKWHDWFAIQQSEVIGIGDLNADAKDDFYTFLQEPVGHCYTSLSTGTSMSGNVLWREKVLYLCGDKPFVGDVNGDGKGDAVIFAQTEGKVYVSLAQ